MPSLKNNTGMNILYVIVNDDPILEFDRGKPVPGHQRQYLDNMYSQMD